MNYKDFYSHIVNENQTEQPKFKDDELKKGMESEIESTGHDDLAKKMAEDNLGDDPDYYSNMEKCDGLDDIVKTNPKIIVAVAKKDNKDAPASGPHITGDIDGTPVNPTITKGVNESTITEPNAGITSDMKKDGKPARWTINAYPTK